MKAISPTAVVLPARQTSDSLRFPKFRSCDIWPLRYHYYCAAWGRIVRYSPASGQPNDDDAYAANPINDNRSTPKTSYCARQNCRWIYQSLANDCAAWYVPQVRHGACDAYYCDDDDDDGVASLTETGKEEKSEDLCRP